MMGILNGGDTAEVVIMKSNWRYDWVSKRVGHEIIGEFKWEADGLCQGMMYVVYHKFGMHIV